MLLISKYLFGLGEVHIHKHLTYSLGKFAICLCSILKACVKEYLMLCKTLKAFSAMQVVACFSSKK